jgi:DNA-binding transcriptional MerR regulator
MQIGTIAKRTGLSVDAVRFYERNSLLPSPSRTPGGFRQYGEKDVETLEFIRSAQGLGFTLREIHELLELRDNRLQPCAPVRRQLEQKLSQVRQKLADMKKLEHGLRLALRKCNDQIRKRSSHCPLLTRKTKGQGRTKAQQ